MTPDITASELDWLLAETRLLTAHQCAAIAERVGEDWPLVGKRACGSAANEIRVFGAKNTGKDNG